MFSYKYWRSSANAYYYTFHSANGGKKLEITTRNFENEFKWKSDISNQNGAMKYTVDGQAYTYKATGETYFIGSVTDVPAVTHQEYKYKTRTATTIYKFYKWSSWSSYSTTKVTASDTREVRTQTYYKYRLK